MSHDRTCPRCGGPLPEPPDPHGRGRRRIWCSDDCRSRAYAERQAAARAGLAVRVVEIPRSVSAWPVWPSLADPHSYATAAIDVNACVDLLDALTDRVRRKSIDPRVRAAAYSLLDALLNHGRNEAPKTAPQHPEKDHPGNKIDAEIDRYLFGG